MKNAWKWIVPILCLTLLLAACGAEPAAEPTAEPTEAPAAETLPPETPEPVDLMTQGVAVTIGSREYSPAEVNYLYTTQFNQVANGYYGSLFGLDASLGAQGLGELAYTGPEQEGKEYATWRDYFLDSSYLYLAQTQHLLDYAAEKGIELSEEEIAQADEDLASIESYAAAYGFESLDDFMLTFFGEGVTMEVLRTMELENALAGKAYYAFQDDMSFSDEELEEEYALLSGDYDSFSFAVYTVRARAGEAGRGRQEEERPFHDWLLLKSKVVSRVAVHGLVGRLVGRGLGELVGFLGHGAGLKFRAVRVLDLTKKK